MEKFRVEFLERNPIRSWCLAKLLPISYNFASWVEFQEEEIFTITECQNAKFESTSMFTMMAYL
jgi:hypothetical protein